MRKAEGNANADDSFAPSKELQWYIKEFAAGSRKAVPEDQLMIALQISRAFLLLAKQDYGDYICQPEAGQWGLLNAAEQNILKVIKERNETKTDRN